MSATYRYQDLFRPIYEVYAIAIWLAAAVLFLLSAATSPFPAKPFLALTAVAITMAFWRAMPASRLYLKRKALAGHALAFITIEQLRKKVLARPDAIWLGTGFTWSQQHTQQLHDIMRADPEKLTPRDNDQIGNRYLHGIGDREEDIYFPIDHNASHTLLMATTRAIKTRFMEVLIAQAILRGESVIVIDPKGDSDLHQSMLEMCRLMGREDDFIFFHPAFPSRSARIDPLMNFTRSTGLASRIASLLPGGSDGATFVAFGQMAVNNINQGILMIDEKPNLSRIRRILEGGGTNLVRRACESYFNKIQPDWRVGVQKYLLGTRSKGKTEEDIAAAYISYYRETIQIHATKASAELDGLLSQYEHDKSHFSKMITTLMPLLGMLTSGDLGKLLSPDHTDAEDPRPITDFKRIIDNRQICYVGLDSLSDVITGSAIGALMLSDLTAVAGDRYNYGADLRPVNLYVDEASEVVNEPFIAMLNKAGGAKFRITVASQVVPGDFAAKMGDENKARMILGNINNVVAGRTMDQASQEYFCEGIPKTVVRTIEQGIASATSTKDATEFSAGIKESLKETEADTIPPPILGTLPNLEYFARVSGGRIIKARVPILKKDAA